MLTLLSLPEPSDKVCILWASADQMCHGFTAKVGAVLICANSENHSAIRLTRNHPR